MQKFPLRMKDNDLLVTELYRNPVQEAITSISVYLTPKTSTEALNYSITAMSKNVFLGQCGNWIEIAYGTSSGTVRVIVQHPETVGHGINSNRLTLCHSQLKIIWYISLSGPQLFQTFTVHRSPINKVKL